MNPFYFRNESKNTIKLHKCNLSIDIISFMQYNPLISFNNETCSLKVRDC